MASLLRSPRPGRRLLATATAAVLLVPACSASGDDATPATFTLPPLPTSSTTAPPLVTQPPAPAATEPAATTTSTTEPPATTTTEPLAVQELVLRGDGIGSARFGADPDVVIDYVSSILGGDTADTGWVDPFTFAACDGTLVRRVDWGVLSLLFGDLSPVATGRRHFVGWEYGLVGQIGDPPAGLRTAGGITLGSRVIDLITEFPETGVNDGEADLSIPPSFYVSDNFRGLLTGTTVDDVVTVIFGGHGCAE
ncbi:MAG TPA: hypothetical protein VIS05_06165 [Ilumatobacter sp.]